MNTNREGVFQAGLPLFGVSRSDGVFVLSLQQLEAQRQSVASAVWNMAVNTKCADAASVDELLQSIPLPQVSSPASWQQPDVVPSVPLGDELNCFIALRSKLDGVVRVVTMHYVNKPIQTEEDGSYPDWTLWNDGEPVGMVGWAEKGIHPGYSNYFEPFSPKSTEIVGWQPVLYPVAPAIGEDGELLDGRVSPVDQKQVGTYRKFVVQRTDGRDQPGGDRADAKYFVLDTTHDKHAKAALAAYVVSVRADYPLLADAMAKQYKLFSDVAARSYVQEVPDHCDRIVWKTRYFHLPLKAPTTDAAVEAVKYALRVDREDSSGMVFLECWNQGEFDAIRREWDAVPEAVFIGADPLHPQTAAAMQRQGDSELVDWLEKHGAVRFGFSDASITFTVPESLKGSNSIRELLFAAATAKDEQL